TAQEGSSSARADQLNCGARREAVVQLRQVRLKGESTLAVESGLNPLAAAFQFLGQRRVAMRNQFHEADGSDLIAVTKDLLPQCAEDHFGAAATKVQKEERSILEGFVRGDALESVVRLL